MNTRTLSTHSFFTKKCPQVLKRSQHGAQSDPKVPQKPSKIEPRTVILGTFVAMATSSGAAPFSIVFLKKPVLETGPPKKQSQIDFLTLFQKMAQRGIPRGGGESSLFNVFFSLGRLLGPRDSPGSPQVSPSQFFLIWDRFGSPCWCFFCDLGDNFYRMEPASPMQW